MQQALGRRPQEKGFGELVDERWPLKAPVASPVTVETLIIVSPRAVGPPSRGMKQAKHREMEANRSFLLSLFLSLKGCGHTAVIMPYLFPEERPACGRQKQIAVLPGINL